MRRFNPNDEQVVAGCSLVATVDNGTLATPGIEFKLYDWITFYIITTDADADTTINAKAQEDTVVTMDTPATDIANLAITEFTAAATVKIAKLVVNEGDITKPFVRCLATMGNGTSGAEVTIIALGHLKDYAPGDDPAIVVEEVKLDIS